MDGASRYCLVAQEHDTDGELETKLYKVCNLYFIYVKKITYFLCV